MYVPGVVGEFSVAHSSVDWIAHGAGLEDYAAGAVVEGNVSREAGAGFAEAFAAGVGEGADPVDSCDSVGEN